MDTIAVPENVMIIEIVRERPNQITREVWTVALRIDLEHCASLELRTYSVQTRPTRQHGFAGAVIFDRYRRRTSTMPSEGVPLPEDVIAEAKSRICAAVMALEVDRG